MYGTVSSNISPFMSTSLMTSRSSWLFAKPGSERNSFDRQPDQNFPDDLFSDFLHLRQTGLKQLGLSFPEKGFHANSLGRRWLSVASLAVRLASGLGFFDRFILA
ncbi:hypothetical protein F2Q68_00001525 [Brassica cretica]|uniref:Uncharacterized protein n=1 Tax=Brassica cretica TaxID=69181 RepID=A0A8S9JIB6_BRACR|nr:hypothetical protein F2Q68_00001525 [Brassica cretica]